MLKWKWRHQVLKAEIEYYNPDVLLLQEVDEAKVDSFWRPLLKALGLISVFHTFPGKAHGLLIAYRSSLFFIADELRINYDEINDPAILKHGTSKNTGFAVALHFQEELIKQQSPGIIVGNSHLFWHPDGSYERARQLGVLSIELENFAKNYANWPLLLGGDFNSSPDDIPYTFLIQRPPEISSIPPHTLGIFARSIPYLISKQPDSDSTTQISVDDHTKSLIVLFQQIADHSTVSLYGENYRQVHPANSIVSDYHEPAFSNWAHSWRGLLDYIFYFKPNDRASQIRVLELLRMPEPAEMGPEPSGQPRESQYPSDHLCIMATLSII